MQPEWHRPDDRQAERHHEEAYRERRLDRDDADPMRDGQRHFEGGAERFALARLCAYGLKLRPDDQRRRMLDERLADGFERHVPRLRGVVAREREAHRRRGRRYVRLCGLGDERARRRHEHRPRRGGAFHHRRVRRDAVLGVRRHAGGGFHCNVRPAGGRELPVCIRSRGRRSARRRHVHRRRRAVLRDGRDNGAGSGEADGRRDVGRRRRRRRHRDAGQLGRQRNAGARRGFALSAFRHGRNAGDDRPRARLQGRPLRRSVGEVRSRVRRWRGEPCRAAAGLRRGRDAHERGGRAGEGEERPDVEHWREFDATVQAARRDGRGVCRDGRRLRRHDGFRRHQAADKRLADRRGQRLPRRRHDQQRACQRLFHDERLRTRKRHDRHALGFNALPSRKRDRASSQAQWTEQRILLVQAIRHERVHQDVHANLHLLEAGAKRQSHH